MVGVHIGINTRPDKILLHCSEERATELTDILKRNEEMKGLDICKVEEGLKISLPKGDVSLSSEGPTIRSSESYIKEVVYNLPV